MSKHHSCGCSRNRPSKRGHHHCNEESSNVGGVWNERDFCRAVRRCNERDHRRHHRRHHCCNLFSFGCCNRRRHGGCGWGW